MVRSNVVFPAGSTDRVIGSDGGVGTLSGISMVTAPHRGKDMIFVRHTSVGNQDIFSNLPAQKSMMRFNFAVVFFDRCGS